MRAPFGQRISCPVQKLYPLELQEPSADEPTVGPEAAAIGDELGLPSEEESAEAIPTPLATAPIETREDQPQIPGETPTV